MPAGQHEPAPDSRSRDAVPDARRAVRLHFVLAGARDLAPGRGCLRVRACGRGQGAAGRVAADRRMSTHFQPPVQGSTMKNFSTNIPTRILQVLLVACFVLPLAACNKEEAPKADEKAPVPAPPTDDIVEGRGYGSAVVRRNMGRSEEHTSELPAPMRISYAVFCLKKKKNTNTAHNNTRQ